MRKCSVLPSVLSESVFDCQTGETLEEVFYSVLVQNTGLSNVVKMSIDWQPIPSNPSKMSIDVD